MKTRYAKFILILLSGLLISAQTYAVPAFMKFPVCLQEKEQDPNYGMSMDNPINVVIQDCCFSYTNEANYNVGYTGKLRLYYKIQIEEPMIIAVQTRTNVPIQTFILDEHGNTVVLDNGGNINETRLVPATYYVFQTAHDKDIYLHTVITGTSAIVGNCLHVPIQIEQSAGDGSMFYSKLCNTTEYTDHYQGRNTNDIFFALDVKKRVSCNVIVEPGELKDGVELTFMNGNQKTLYTILKRKEIKLELSPGMYYLVAEGMEKNGRFIIEVKGEVLDVPLDPEQREVYTPSQNMNYVRTIIPTRVVDTMDSLFYLSKTKHSIRYFDHLGRPVQEVAYKSSPSGQDMVTSHEYDKLGREGKQWLPVMRRAKTSTGTFIPRDTIALYAEILYSDRTAFSYPMYEDSPLNRVVENYGPGEAWQNTGHGKKIDYRINTAKDRCLYFSVKGTKDNPQLLQHGLYQVYELEVVEVKDEDGHTGCSFTDREERVILNRQIADKDTLDTYYIYDDFGNLCFVLPPVAVDNLTASPQSVLDKYAYQYRYDYRQRCIGKKLPGCGWTEQIYDHDNRLVFTRDGEQQKRGEWSFNFLDLLDRQVLSGVYRGNLPSRNICDTSDIYAVFEPNGTGTYYGYRIHCPAGISVDKLEILQMNYYDTYKFVDVWADAAGKLGYVEDSKYGKRYTEDMDLHCKDLLTGSITAVLETKQKLFGCYFYDYDRNLIQARHTTVSGKIMSYKSLFNFNGQLVNAVEEYDKDGVIQKSYVYDHMGRLTKEVHTVGTDMTSFAYDYDAVGRVAALTRIHGKDLLTTTNKYNIRSWLEKSNSSFFAQTLHYTDGSGTPCYNGNISSMSWTAGTSPTGRGYTFKYDGLNRMKDALYSEGNNLATATHQFDEQVTGYDKQGNILGLKRRAQISQTGYGLIDDLSMTYDGTRLKAVNDKAASSVYGSNGMEFRDGAKTVVEYSYDANGNLTQDLNKNITDIQYNYLNLAKLITFKDGSSISYLYDANGVKLRTTHTIGGTITTTDYCGNAIYENKVLDKLLTNKGYVTVKDNVYHYYFQDHQGNNRVIVKQDGTVEEVNHYYPFGGIFASLQNIQPYKYNGKELDSRKGLNWYDYGARHYDATLGRFMTADPMAESDYPVNPYVYCLNNPFNRVDPTGLSSHYDWESHRYVNDDGHEVSWESVQKEYGIGTGNGPDDPPTISDVDAVTGAAPRVAMMSREEIEKVEEGLVLTIPVPYSVLIAELLESLVAAPEAIIVTIPILLQGDESPEYVKRASDSSKNEKHGDGGRALEKEKKRIGELEEQLNRTENRKDGERIKKKIQNIRKDGEIKRKGVEHHN